MPTNDPKGYSCWKPDRTTTECSILFFGNALTIKQTYLRD